MRFQLAAHAEERAHGTVCHDALVAVSHVEMERTGPDEDAAACAEHRIARIGETQQCSNEGISRPVQPAAAETQMGNASRRLTIGNYRRFREGQEPDAAFTVER